MKQTIRLLLMLVVIILSSCQASSEGSSFISSPSEDLTSIPLSNTPSSEEDIASINLSENPTSIISTSEMSVLYATTFSSLEGFLALGVKPTYNTAGPVSQRWGAQFGGFVSQGAVDNTQALILQFDINPF